MLRHSFDLLALERERDRQTDRDRETDRQTQTDRLWEEHAEIV